MENEKTPWAKLFDELMGTAMLQQRLETTKACVCAVIDYNGTTIKVVKGTKEEIASLTALLDVEQSDDPKETE